MLAAAEVARQGSVSRSPTWSRCRPVSSTSRAPGRSRCAGWSRRRCGCRPSASSSARCARSSASASRLLTTALAAEGHRFRTPRWRGSGIASACSRGGRARSRSPPTRPWRPRSATSWPCPRIHRRRRWCPASTKSPRSGRWSGPPTLPVRLGHPEAASFHYIQPGTTTLFAALEVATGWVTETCAERQRRQEFGAFLKQVAAAYPRRPQGPDPRQPPHPCRPREMTVGLAMAKGK
jgi:hypothetical protein